MRDERVQRVAAFLAELFEAGTSCEAFNFDESEVLLDPSNPEWYDQLAHALREEFEDNPDNAPHDWTLFERQARSLLNMVYDA